MQTHVAAYENNYQNKYLDRQIFRFYPEAKIIPLYFYDNFQEAETVLDLGFGGGLWFWASFLPSLKRLDGFDLHPEALAAVNDVFDRQEVPPGFIVAHAYIGLDFTYNDLMGLQEKEGEFVFQDYRDDWPENILVHEYDLVAEHGGGFGEMGMRDIARVLNKISNVLAPGGRFFFMNFNTVIGQEKMDRLLEGAGLELADYHTVSHPPTPLGVERFFYGYATKR